MAEVRSADSPYVCWRLFPQAPPVSRQRLSRNATVDRKFRPKLQLHLDSRSDFEEVIDLVDVHLAALQNGSKRLLAVFIQILELVAEFRFHSLVQ